MDWNDLGIDADLGWKAAVLGLAARYAIPWIKSKITKSQLELAQKVAREAIHWARSEGRWRARANDPVPTGKELEDLAVRHFAEIAEGALRKWTDKDIRSTVRDVYEQLRREERAIGAEMKRYLEQMAAEGERISDTIERGLRQFDANMARLKPRDESPP